MDRRRYVATSGRRLMTRTWKPSSTLRAVTTVALESSSGGYILEVTGSSGRCSTQFDLGDESRYLGVMTLAAT